MSLSQRNHINTSMLSLLIFGAINDISPSDKNARINMQQILHFFSLSSNSDYHLLVNRPFYLAFTLNNLVLEFFPSRHVLYFDF